MLKPILILIAVALPSAAFAQDQAAIDPSAPLPSVDAVIGQCQLVVGEAAASNSGVCITATQGYLAELKGRDPAAIDQSITDLVVALAPLVQDDVCNAADEEVAQAIRLASEMASTPEQVAQVVEIADTVAACTGATAAIEAEEPPVGDPASPA